MLIDELRELARKASMAGCVVGNWLVEQDDEVQELISQLRGKPSLNISKTMAVLKSHYPELPFKRTAFGAHMRSECSCHKA